MGNVLAIWAVPSVESESTSTTLVPGNGATAASSERRQSAMCLASSLAMTTAASKGSGTGDPGLVPSSGTPSATRGGAGSRTPGPTVIDDESAVTPGGVDEKDD